MPNNNIQNSNKVAWIAIVVGLLIGFLLKRVRFGFIFGLALGIGLVYLASRKRNQK